MILIRVSLLHKKIKGLTWGGFMSRNRDLNIARSIKVIEWLKSELLESVSLLFRALLKNKDELLLQGLARVQLTAYLLARRVGVNFVSVDEEILILVQRYLKEGHELEEWYGDLSLLREYLESRKKGL
jgi:hypothetical protein